MKNLWQVFRGILIALASVGLLFGGLSLSLAEGNMTATLAPTFPSTSISTSTATFPSTFTLPPTSSPTSQPFTTRADSATPLPPTWTTSLTPPPTNCPHPPGWLSYIVKSGDTLDKLATRFRTSSAALKQANCILTNELLPGAIIYVPPAPTQTRIPCGPPSGWITSYVQPGDTLYRLSQAFGITVPELQNANCMGNSTILHVGQKLFVPPWATRTPSPTFPGLPTPTFVPTDTPNLTPITPTDTLIETPTNTPSDTPTFTPNDTPTDTPTPTF
jgi:LysM repeat protein